MVGIHRPVKSQGVHWAHHGTNGPRRYAPLAVYSPFYAQILWNTDRFIAIFTFISNLLFNVNKVVGITLNVIHRLFCFKEFITWCICRDWAVWNPTRWSWDSPKYTTPRRLSCPFPRNWRPVSRYQSFLPAVPEDQYQVRHYFMIGKKNEGKDHINWNRTAKSKKRRPYTDQDPYKVIYRSRSVRDHIQIKVHVCPYTYQGPFMSIYRARSRLLSLGNENKHHGKREMRLVMPQWLIIW